MTKENPSKKERIEAAKKRSDRNTKRIKEHRKDAQNTGPLPSAFSWLFKRKEK